ncbi:alpha/beta hydrolase [Kriegella aquimaris]|uniref:Alpha/beta hydrolase family protein n=1 Tax=Kriegella aquimaris TaxID=192904 RepID=A0A1G9JNS7_9FLAO|nr:alpha/beta hydrolase fold domain-containing protein [Kriegella aquimaris]SDL38946.1 Alpha/beta hydrolase family protein [Kriegella aquimaris]
MKNKILLFIHLLIVTIGSAQEFKSLIYFENDSISLELDLFLPKKMDTLKTPLVIYVHGGGFSNGKRKGGHLLAKHLADENIACASISYTLYMENKDFGCTGVLAEKIKAIQIAASQLWHATSYLIEQKNQIHIDPSKIFIAGSSAGAETVLHAAFWNRKQMQLFEPKLAPDFLYKGVISGAGAIMDLNLITTQNHIPLFVFHGDNDPLVPYDVAAHHYCAPNAPGWLMFFGSHAIAEHIQKLGGTSRLMTYIGGNHSIAGEHFYKKQEAVVDFITNILDGKKFNDHQIFTIDVEK